MYSNQNGYVCSLTCFNVWVLVSVCVCVVCSASTSNMAKLEEMERLLREAQAEKKSLLEHKVTTK